jgi:trk system potassium uptake protein TrkH
LAPFQVRFGGMKKSVSSLIVSSFSLAIFIGAGILMLPISTAHAGVDPLDALFTAASAVTVTGLTVLDTATDFTTFGQVVILLLLQIGGLGFMTFSTFTILIMGKSVSYTDMTVIENEFTVGTYKNVTDLVKKIVLMTFIIETLGAVILYFQFTRLHGAYRVFASIFHSISAFCNAGFSIFSNSFENYINHWGINVTLMVLIICGGIGFLVLNEITLFARRKIKKLSRFSLHSKLVLITSGVLILGGFLVIFIEELLNTHNHFSFDVKLLTSLFQSVTARTAGFNTINLNYFSLSSIFIIIVLMFIGASPGSTGGGIKTSSACVVFSYFRSRLQGKERIEVFYRNIAAKTFEKALIVVILSILVISVCFLLLLNFEREFKMSELIFESVSAFGTVGLSTGITSDLSFMSRLTLIATMFIGRIGPLTLLVAIGRMESRAALRYPEENIMIG